MIPKKKILSFCLIACSIYISALAQENRIPASFKGTPDCGIQCKIAHYFVEKANKECGHGFFFTKFTVSPDGDISNIEFSNGTKSFLQDFLREALHATKGMWNAETINGKPVESKPFLLPVYYFYDAPCKGSLDTVIEVGREVYTARPLTLDPDPEYRVGPNYAFEHMLDFSTKEPAPTFRGIHVFPQFEGYVISSVYLRKDLFKVH